MFNKIIEYIKDKEFNKTLLNTFYYFGGTVLSFLISIFTQPIFSKYLSLEDFAIIGYFTAIQALLFPLFSMSLPFYFMAKYWVKDESYKGYENLSFILNFLNLWNGILAVFSYFVICYYFEIFNVSFTIFPFLLIIIFHLFLEKYKIFFLMECRANKNGLNYFLINILQIILNTIFSLSFVIFFNGGAVGRMSGILFSFLVVSIVVILILKKEKKLIFSLKLDFKKIKIALKYCFPLVFASYAYYPIGNLDILLLENIKDTNEFGYYTIGLSISAFLFNLFTAIFQSIEPDLYKLLTLEKYSEYKKKVILYLITITIITFCFLYISNDVVSFLTYGKYNKASYYVNYFVISILLMQYGVIFEQIFISKGNTKSVMNRNIIIGFSSIVIFKYLIDKYQFYGASIAKIIISSLFVIIGFLIYKINRKYA